MTFRAYRGVIGGLALGLGAAFLQGCDGTIGLENDKRSESEEAVKTEKPSENMSKETANGQVSVEMPLTDDSEFDQVLIRVCSRQSKPFHMKHKGKQHHHPEPVGEFEEDRTGWEDGIKPTEYYISGKQEDVGSDEETSSEDQQSDIAFMPWPLPGPEDQPHHRWCHVVVEQYLDFESGKSITLDGIPFGTAVVYVELMRGGQAIEAGWGKVDVAPGQIAHAVVAVRPVAGSIAVEIVRLGDYDYDTWPMPRPMPEYMEDDRPEPIGPPPSPMPVQTATTN